MERSEKIGLSVATAGHIVLFALLSLSLVAPPDEDFRNPPVEVMITDEVGLESTAPDPSLITPATSVAPELGLPEDLFAPPAEPAPSTQAPDPVRPPVPTAVERPVTKADPVPRTRDPRDRRRPDKPTSAVASKTPKGSRLGDDFLKGVTDAPSVSRSQSPRAEAIGPAAKASLQQELYRRLKPHWQPPTGADAEKLRTTVTARLDEYGNIVGTPSARTTGQTASNRNQVALHQERAIAAVRLAAPYSTFPSQYYDEWKEIEPTLYLGL